MEMTESDRKAEIILLNFLPGVLAQEEMMERLSNYFKVDHAEVIELV